MMECACIDADVSDFVEVLFEKEVIARNAYRCIECHKTIEIGEKHWFEKTVYEGFFDGKRTCLDCYSVRKHLLCSFYYGEIWELVSNHICDYGDEQPWVKISRLTPKARSTVCEMIECSWDE
jgi:hypothetical protein